MMSSVVSTQYASVTDITEQHIDRPSALFIMRRAVKSIAKLSRVFTILGTAKHTITSTEGSRNTLHLSLVKARLFHIAF